MPSAIATLAAITQVDLDRVGGKAFNCARLHNAGFPVPDGLVVGADAGEADIDGLLAHPWFREQFPGCQFAVRSSGVGEDGAGHSFAGIHDTFLNVDLARVPEAVHGCRRSVLSEQARAYRRASGLEGDARTGVLIQPMIEAVVSGVAFTVHPVTGDDELVVNAAPGLGEALVSGQIEPDEFRISKSDHTTVASHLAGSRAESRIATLTDADRRDLSEWLLRIEQFYGTPQDVEWCRDRDRLWILQSRPVTTRPAGLSSASPSTVATGPDIEWSRANLAEVFPDQMSPQAVSAYEEMLNGGQRMFMGGLLGPESTLGPPFKAFGGRLYINITQLRHVTKIGGAPPSSVLRSLGHSDAIHSSDEVAVRAPLREVLARVPDLLRLVRRDLRANALLREQDADNDAQIALFTAVDPATLTDGAIWARLDAWRKLGPERMQVVLLLGSMVFLEEMLRKAARAAGQSYEDLVYPQLAAGEPSVSTQQAFDLVDLAELARGEPFSAWYFIATETFSDYRSKLAGGRFLPAFDRFLDQYGHRGHYESDWSLPRYREDPSPLLYAIRSHLGHPPAESRAAIAQRLDAEAKRSWASFHARLSSWQKLTMAPRVRRLLRKLKQRYVMREHCRSDLTRVLYYARQWHLVLADRFVDSGFIARRADYFLLVVDDIDGVIRGRLDPLSLRVIVADRARALIAQASLKMPLLMRQSDVATVLAGRWRGAAADSGERFDGLCVSRGVVEAEAIVIRDPREFRLMRKGAILVAPATDPSWTPLFTLASGVIVEVGGILSHASTVAREYGLPALANVKDATTRLKTGDRVRLDASGGFAQRLESRAS